MNSIDRPADTPDALVSRRRLVGGAIAAGAATAGSLLLSSGPAHAEFDPTAIHQTGAETKTGELTLTPDQAGSKALVLRAAPGQAADLSQVQRSDGDVQAAWNKTGGLTVFGVDNTNPRPFEMWVRRNGVLNPTGPSVYINYGGHLRMLSSLVVSGRTLANTADPVVLPSNAAYMFGLWSDVSPGNPVMVVRPNSESSPNMWGLDHWGYRRMQIEGDGTLRWAPRGTGNIESKPGLVSNNAPTDAALGRAVVNGMPTLSVTGAPFAITPSGTNKPSLLIQTVANQTSDVVNVLDPTQGNVFRVTRLGGVYTIAHPNRVSGVFQSSNTVGVTIGSESNHMFSILTNNKFRTRWENNGNIGLNGNMSTFGDGIGVIGVANAVEPPLKSPSGGFILYAAEGYLRVRSSTGDVFDTTKQPAIPSPDDNPVSLKQAVDTIRVALQKLGVTA
ncbi:MAG: hypothetical protein ACR2KK_06680 [Acidimicrobiales bacterium]